jgi:hypothetical protein
MYVLEFKIDGLPKTANKMLRSGWQMKHVHSKKWKREVWGRVWHKKPEHPLYNAKLTLTRHSSVRPDYDGLVSSFKSVIDGLVEAGVLINDRYENIGNPEYLWVKAPPAYGHIVVKVEEIQKTTI